MKAINRILITVLSLVIVLTPVFAFAEETPKENLPPIESLDTSAIDGKLIAYKGFETYFVVYPYPEEAEPRFDIRNAQITVDDESIIIAEPEKEEQNRFGSVNITGLKLGKTTVTVIDPESGKSCSVEVTVLPGIIYRVQNFFMFIDYIPFFIGMRILSLLNR